MRHYLLLILASLALTGSANASYIYGTWNVTNGGTHAVSTVLVPSGSGAVIDGEGYGSRIWAYNATSGITVLLDEVYWGFYQASATVVRGAPWNTNPSWAIPTVGSWSVYASMLGDEASGRAILSSTLLVQFTAYIPNVAPVGTLTLSATTINFGQTITVSSTMTDADSNLQYHGIMALNPSSTWVKYPGTNYSWWGGYTDSSEWVTITQPAGNTVTSGSSNTVSGTFQPSAIGSYLIHSNGKDSEGVWSSNGPQSSLTVNKATPTGTFAGRTFSPGTLLYTVTAADLNAVFANPYSASVAAPTGSITYSIVGPGTAVSAGTTLTAGNTYTIRATLVSDSNYISATADSTWTVSRATQAAVAVSSPATTTFGASYTATATGGSGSGSYVWELRGGTATGAAITAGGVVTSTSIGTVIFRAYRAGDTNYLQSDYTSDFTLTIGQATQAAVTVSASPTTVTYGNTSALSSAGGTGAGAVTFAAGAGGSISGSTFTATAGTGTVAVTATKSGGTNYLNQSGSTTITLAKRAVTFTLSGSRAYDGTTTYASGLAVSASGLLAGDTLTSKFTSSANVNVYTSLSGVVIQNASSVDVTANYTISYSGNYSITQGAQNTPTITSAASVTYGNAYTATASVTGPSSGVLQWNLVSATATGAAIDSVTGVLTARSSGNAIIRVRQDSNTNLARSSYTADFTVTISTRPITVTLSGQREYDGLRATPGVSAAITSGTLAAGDSIAYVFGQTTLPTVGTYLNGVMNASSITISNGTSPTNRTSSYTVTRAGGYTITKRAQIITFTAVSSKVYGDAPFSVSATANSGLFITYAIVSGPATISGSTVTLTGAGTVTVSASSSSTSTWEAGSQTTSFAVTQAPQTVSISPSSQSVLRSQSVTFTASGGQNGYNWGGTAGASGSGTTNTVTFNTVGSPTVTVESPAGGNYLVSNTATATITVNNAYTLSLTAETGGNVSGAGLYLAGSTVNPVATANAGYVFAGWYGADSGSLSDQMAATGSIVMSADRSLTARFVDYSTAPTVATVDFGNAAVPLGSGTKNALRDAIMTNGGNSPIELRSMTIVSGGTEFSVTSNAGTIAASAAITNTVTFNPKGVTAGVRTGRLIVVSTDFALPLFAYNLSGSAVLGATPPDISLGVTGLALIFPDDTIALNVSVTANIGDISYYDWRVVSPSGTSAWTRVSGPLPILTGSHPFTPAVTGAHTIEVQATHAEGPTSTGTLSFNVVQGLFTRTINARAEPSAGLQIWFTPSASRSQAVDVYRSR